MWAGGLTILWFPMIWPLRSEMLIFLPEIEGSDHCPSDFPLPVPDSEKTEILFEQDLGAAKKGWGNTHPNPDGGCNSLLKMGRLFQKAYHERAGSTC